MSDLVIIDSSVAIKLIVPENQSLQAIGLQSRYRLAAPDILFSECANTLWKKARRGEIGKAEAFEAMDVLVELELDVLDSQDLARDALQIAVEIDHPAYDCLYLGAALRLDSVVATADLKLLRKLAHSGPAWASLGVPLSAFI